VGLLSELSISVFPIDLSFKTVQSLIPIDPKFGTLPPLSLQIRMELHGDEHTGSSMGL